MANSSRNLAQRDNLLASKLNEVVKVLNNREQLINVPAVRTVLPPGASEIIQNFRIPEGFEARVLNASVAPAGQARLDVFHGDESYGAQAGAKIINTTDEFDGGVSFFGTGEFIVKLTNLFDATIDAAASLILTMRPTTAGITGGWIGSGAKGLKDDKGDRGAPGAVGSNRSR